MATGKSDPQCEFDKLFTNQVPHILEKIFFALDYYSFMDCGKVCKAWKELHSSELYQLKAEKFREEKTERKKDERRRYNCHGSFEDCTGQ